MARRNRPSYPGLEDPRAALAELTATFRYIQDLQRRFHIATPAWQVLEDVKTALRAAALHLTNDPYFFGLSPAGQTAYQPPPAPPVPGHGVLR